jgi:hypothetical protein
MKHLLLILSLIFVVACGSGNSSNSSSGSIINSFSTAQSVPSVLYGTWYGYENSTPIEISISSATSVTIKRFSEVRTEKIGVDAQNYYVITDSKNNSYWHILGAGANYLNLEAANKTQLNLNK